MPAEPVRRRYGDRPPESLDLPSQLEGLLHEVWTLEAEWRREDRIDLAARLHAER